MNFLSKDRLIIIILFLLIFSASSLALAEDNLVTLSVRRADVNDVLVMLTEQSGVNLVPDRTVRGEVTLNLKDVKLSEVFEVLRLAHGYQFKEVGNNTVLVSEVKFNSPIIVRLEDGLLDLHAIEEDIKSVLDQIAKEAGINIVMDPSVRGDVSINLNKVPLDEALMIFLQTNGFSLSKSSNLYRVINNDQRDRRSNLNS